MRRAADAVMGGLARVLIHVFFRGVEVEHGDRVGSSGPTVLVANHRNGLVDGLLLMATLPRFPRFLGKSTLFRIPVLWPFLKLGGVVPVYRAQDGAPTTRNRQTFARSGHLLARGGLLAIFPEGISHDEPGLQPLRTGAARIALAAAEEGASVNTVAVALVYDDKQRFRSRALVKVGTPVAADDWLDAYRVDPRDAVRRLTDDLAERLRQVDPDHRSWTEAAVLAEAADIAARTVTDLPNDVGLQDREAIASALAAASDRTDPAVEGVRTSVHAYRRQLALVGLADAQVAADYQSGRLRRQFVGAMVKVVVAVPFAALGVAIHAVPYAVVKRLSRIPANEGMRATVKLLGCFLLFVMVYAVLGIVVGEVFGPWFGLLAAVLAPACGYAAVRLGERVHRIGGAVEGYRQARRGGPVLASVLEARAAVVDAVSLVTGTSPVGRPIGPGSPARPGRPSGG